MNSLSVNPASIQDESCDWFPPAWSLASAPRASAPREPFRVLVCEPRAGLRRQTGAAFRQAALDTTFAADVDEAMSLAKSGRFDVAIVDPEMNNHAGLKLCSTLSRGLKGSRIPVITWCESRSVMLAVRSRIAGATVHLMRPVSLDRFVNAVWDIAAHHASRGELAPSPH